MLNGFGTKMLGFIVNHRAQIMIGAGIIGNTTATIIACKKTLSAKEIVNDHKSRRKEIEEAKEICRREIKIYDIAAGKDDNLYTEQNPCSEEKYIQYNNYLSTDYKKDVAKVYGYTTFKFLRHYAVPAALFVASNISIAFGAGILTKQVAGLTTSLAAVTTAFGDYRNRVKEVIGEEAENRIYTGETVKINKYKDVDDDGNEVEKEETVISTTKGFDPYALLLDRNSYCYHNDIHKTLTELKLLESELNDQLRSKEIITLNEVYEALGYGKTEAGAIVGWVYKDSIEEQEKYGNGDGYISFGIFDHVDENGNIMLNPGPINNQWVNILDSHKSNRQSDTDEYEIWLHFNVDGPITKYMDKKPGMPI